MTDDSETYGVSVPSYVGVDFGSGESFSASWFKAVRQIGKSSLVAYAIDAHFARCGRPVIVLTGDVRATLYRIFAADRNRICVVGDGYVKVYQR